MREIKFRAWDIENKRFVSGYEAFDSVCSWQNDDTGSHIILKQDRFIALQYTGLKDKNGKEIYEGDIVKAEASFDETNICAVEFRYGSFGLVEFDDVDWAEMSGQMYVGDGSDRKHNPDKHPSFEVIGNIYENTQLLNN